MHFRGSEFFRFCKLPKPINHIFLLINLGGTCSQQAVTDDRMVNVQKSGEVYRCNVCGNVVYVTEAGGGELVCHDEPMQLIGTEENKSH